MVCNRSGGITLKYTKNHLSMNTDYPEDTTPRRRAIFIMRGDDYETIEEFAHNHNYTISTVFREAARRMAESIRRGKEN